MSYIVSQTDNNSTISLGKTENEMLAQSFFFERDFIVNTVYVALGRVLLDPSRTIQFKCEMRAGRGSDHKLIVDDTPALSSSWVSEDALTEHGYNGFTFNGTTVLDSGFYYFCFISQVDLRYPVEFSIFKGQTFLGKFIKVEYGTGYYDTNKSLTMIIDGSWQSGAPDNRIIRTGDYVTTSIKDNIS